jgi:monovalent cation:H+ antiporter, CPA1 family
MLAATTWFIREKIPMTWRQVIMLGGMRGAISVALVASLPPSSFKSILQTLTFGVFVFG